MSDTHDYRPSGDRQRPGGPVRGDPGLQAPQAGGADREATASGRGLHLHRDHPVEDASRSDPLERRRRTADDGVTACGRGRRWSDLIARVERGDRVGDVGWFETASLETTSPCSRARRPSSTPTESRSPTTPGTRAVTAENILDRLRDQRGGAADRPERRSADPDVGRRPEDGGPPFESGGGRRRRDRRGVRVDLRDRRRAGDPRSTAAISCSTSWIARSSTS